MRKHSHADLVRELISISVAITVMAITGTLLAPYVQPPPECLSHPTCTWEPLLPVLIIVLGVVVYIGARHALTHVGGIEEPQGNE